MELNQAWTDPTYTIRYCTVRCIVKWLGASHDTRLHQSLVIQTPSFHTVISFLLSFLTHTSYRHQAVFCHWLLILFHQVLFYFSLFLYCALALAVKLIKTYYVLTIKQTGLFHSSNKNTLTWSVKLISHQMQKSQNEY